MALGEVRVAEAASRRGARRARGCGRGSGSCIPPRPPPAPGRAPRAARAPRRGRRTRARGAADSRRSSPRGAVPAGTRRGWPSAQGERGHRRCPPAPEPRSCRRGPPVEEEERDGEKRSAPPRARSRTSTRTTKWFRSGAARKASPTVSTTAARSQTIRTSVPKMAAALAAGQRGRASPGGAHGPALEHDHRVHHRAPARAARGEHAEREPDQAARDPGPAQRRPSASRARGDGEGHVDDEAHEDEPPPGAQPLDERLRVGHGLADLDAGQRGEDRGDHERIEDSLERRRRPGATGRWDRRRARRTPGSSAPGGRAATP